MHTVHELLAQLKLLSLHDQRRIAESLNTRIAATDAALPTPVEPIAANRGSYVLKYVRCGKPNCRCASGELHGPYWYLHQRVGGRVVRSYIGKQRSAN